MADFRYSVLPLIVLLTLAAGEAAAQTRNPTAPASAREAQPPASHGENFSAGKSPSQLFASDCTGSGCHRGPQGLSKDWSPAGLSAFLREHYTNSRESAAALTGYLLGVGSDPRATRPEPAQRGRAATRQEEAPKRGEELPPRPRRAVPTEPEAARPELARPEASRPEAARPETPRPAAQPRQHQRRQQSTSAPAPAPAAEAPAPAPATAAPAEPAPAPEAAAPPPPPTPQQFDIFD